MDASLNTTISINDSSEKTENHLLVDEPFLVEEGKGDENKKTGATEHNQDNNNTKTTTLNSNTAVADATTSSSAAVVSTSKSTTTSSPPSSSSSSHQHRVPIPITDPSILALALTHHIFIDSNGEFELTYREILTHPSIWLMTLFFTTILTPGWGIKLGSLAILRAMFHSSTDFAAQSTALYVTFYCLGRLFGGLVAERLGAIVTYDILLTAMLVGYL